MRRMKERFGDTILYKRDEGAIHGFIHPTPWDDFETMPEMNQNITIYGFFRTYFRSTAYPLLFTMLHI